MRVAAQMPHPARRLLSALLQPCLGLRLILQLEAKLVEASLPWDASCSLASPA